MHRSIEAMIAVRKSADQPTAIVGSPAYFAANGVPKTAAGPAAPQLHHAAAGHQRWHLCVGAGTQDRRTEAKMTGQAIFTSVQPMVKAALPGHGLAFLTEDMVLEHIQAGQLKKVLSDWCPRFPGLHAYDTSRRHPTRALTTVIDALREPAAI
jgi:DNA-binding transcriptional LysR family regulator